LTGGETTSWTSAGANTSYRSATLERHDADQEEEESGQRELHV